VETPSRAKATNNSICTAVCERLLPVRV